MAIDSLDLVIKDLRGKILDDLLAVIPDLRNEMTKMNAEVQEAIDDIKDDIETAAKVVKLIGKIDEMVGFLKPLFV